MNISKEAKVSCAGCPTPEQLGEINRFAKTPMEAEEVYVFSVRLCDDQIDRDFERFDTAALPRLAELFVGKTGIVDHTWSAENQIARIFRTEVVQKGGVSYIRAWAYMRRTDHTAPVIEQIEAGIRREVSVGCAMAGRTCSICGAPYGSCEHEKGVRYGGEVCAAVLCDPVDAYEFSFVAVPAQPAAGVLKAWKGGEGMTLTEMIQKTADKGKQQEFETLCKEAALGRHYAKELRSEVVRLSLLLDVGLPEETLQTVTERLLPEELEQIRTALAEKAAECFPPQPQLTGRVPAGEGCSMDFMI
jgi:hypothetical protein